MHKIDKNAPKPFGNSSIQKQIEIVRNPCRRNARKQKWKTPDKERKNVNVHSSLKERIKVMSVHHHRGEGQTHPTERGKMAQKKAKIGKKLFESGLVWGKKTEPGG